MDTNFDTTQTRYADFLSRTPAYIGQTLEGLQKHSIDDFKDIVRAKSRILFTGVGSSMPAAWHGANCLRQQGLPAQFLPTGSILGMQSLVKTDLVVLSSQGVNRADALLIIEKVVASEASLVIVTANQSPEIKAKADLLYYFLPAEEKLFCRPTGVATNYALMEKLCSNGPVDDDALVTAWRAGSSRDLALQQAKRYIVLSSDDMMPVAWNVSLALREGNGLHSELMDIETYGHGNYVADLRNRQSPDDFVYIMVHGARNSPSERSVRRILPFIQGIDAHYALLSADYQDTAQSGMHILANIAQFIYDYNQSNGYNMNRPLGKEENRYYHELDSYYA